MSSSTPEHPHDAHDAPDVSDAPSADTTRTPTGYPEHGRLAGPGRFAGAAGTDAGTFDISAVDGEAYADGLTRTGGTAQPTGWPADRPAHPYVVDDWDHVEAPREPADRIGRKTVVGLATTAVVAVLGIPLGLLWAAIAPRLPGIVQSDGVYLVDVYGEQRAAQEGWYVILSIGAGVLIAILAWILLRRYRGAVIVSGLAAGGVAAGWLMWYVGHNIGRAHAFALQRSAPVGTIIHYPVDLRIKNPHKIEMWHGWLPHVGGVLVYLAIAAVAMYLLLSVFSPHPSLNVRRQRSRRAP